MMKPRNRNCPRCGKPVRPSEDHIRVCKFMDSLMWHWPCLLALLAEREHVTAAECLAARKAEV